MSAGRDVARAIDALRRGWPIAVDGVRFLAIETADPVALAEFDGDAPADLLISGNRAATLKLINQINAAEPADPVLIKRSPWVDFDMAVAVADPALDLSNPLKGPFTTAPLCAPPTARAALRLTRMAGLLPALFTKRAGNAEAETTTEAVAAYAHRPRVRIAARAHLPSRHG